MKYDLIIIGSGAGGGTLAYALASTGLKILILERGDYLPREIENWDPAANFIDGRYTTKEEWYDKEGKKFTPGEHYFVGGKTKVYGAALLRLREKDFGEVQHKEGTSPAWPLKYKDFQPYYNEAERLYHVHGERGADPTEPPETEPYPNKALKHEPRIQEIYDGLHKEGLKAFPLPIGIRRNDDNPEQSQCVRCETCDGFPCLVDAKSDAHTTCIKPALQSGNVDLLTNTKVEKIVAKDGSVSHVEVEREGKKETYSGDVVVTSCGSINSSVLLLKSGIANSSGLVGRHYMCHNNTAIVAVSKKPNPTLFQKTLAINDFYYGAPDWDFPLGHIQLLGKVKGPMLQAGAPVPTPEFPLDKLADHSVGWWITTEDLPDPENRVTIDEKGKITLHYTQNNTESHKKLFEKLKEIVNKLDETHHFFPTEFYLGQKVGLAGVAHQVGTCRFGEDPKTSVLDLNCKTHDLDNLYVVDGSFFPSSSSVNPGLTIIANALRIADHLCERFKVKRQKNPLVQLDSFYQLED